MGERMEDRKGDMSSFPIFHPSEGKTGRARSGLPGRTVRLLDQIFDIDARLAQIGAERIVEGVIRLLQALDRIEGL